MKYFRLSQDAVKALADTYSTPLLVLSLEQIELNYKLLAENMPDVKIYYAVKANPDERIIRKLDTLGGYFDVASDGEMRMLNQLGIDSDRMVYANPVKTNSGLKVAHDVGVHKFTFDSESEIEKIATAIPGGTALLRIRVDNPHALVDLNKKFGVHPDEALALLTKARVAGLDVAGLCFHVGSQSTSSEAYLAALKSCRKLFDAAKGLGMHLHILDIGGGFPIPTLTEEPDVAQMAAAIYKVIRQYFPDTEIWAEPGRYICGTAVNLITQVIGTKVRNNQQWYFLDDGLYGTFSGVIFDHWDFELETFKTGKMIPATFAGPSCDSLDIMFRDKHTVPMEIGDLILVPNCGAYTSASATVFNGFAKTQIVVWEEVYKAIQAKLELATAG
ncbi:Lysine/ornithine decarboxylase [Sporomusa silvacetica DSM 10669]|uniref:ornithine decarboxylase n=1 Tax=Sporomusa silvacetica DSM 10669 TaxID=1123289 RepID=A0ABZ3IEI2_9FIRM|nr:type III PLP-dependent enzyme [Sporomusa silvacetica]OZC17956.1 lysine/ornithine decarboxylase [Sporomusa silvacetica DSM 10669]